MLLLIFSLSLLVRVRLIIGMFLLVWFIGRLVGFLWSIRIVWVSCFVARFCSCFDMVMVISVLRCMCEFYIVMSGSLLFLMVYFMSLVSVMFLLLVFLRLSFSG